MRLTLAIRTPDGKTWRRQVERDYPGVPHPGDWVYLADTDEGAGLFATPVALVSFENDGRLDPTPIPTWAPVLFLPFQLVARCVGYSEPSSQLTPSSRA
jgi:hypothetical protein